MSEALKVLQQPGGLLYHVTVNNGNLFMEVMNRLEFLTRQPKTIFSSLGGNQWLVHPHPDSREGYVAAQRQLATDPDTSGWEDVTAEVAALSVAGSA